MRLGLGLGLGMHSGKPSGPQPALFWDFEHMGTLPADLAVERTGLAGMWQDDGTLGFGPHNIVSQSEAIHASPWNAVIAGTGVSPVVSGSLGDPWGGAKASRIQLDHGASSTSADRSIWRSVSVARSAGNTWAYSVWLKAFDAASVGKTVRVTDEGTSATTIVTLSADFQRVTISGVASAASASVLFECRGTYTTRTADVVAVGAQLNRGTTAGVYVATAATAIYLMRFEKHPALGGKRWLALEPSSINVLTNPLLTGGGVAPTGWTNSGTGTAVASVYGSSDGAVAYSFPTVAQRNDLRQAFTLVSNTTYSFSVMVESVTGSVQNQEVLTVAGPPAGASIVGMYRDGQPVSSTADVAPGKLSLVLSGTYTGASATFRFGNGVSNATTGTVVCSRPHLEALGHPTSFTAGTRSGDTRVAYSLPAALQTALASGGTIFADFAFASDSSLHQNNRHALCLTDGTTNNRAIIYNISGKVGAYMRTGGVDQYNGASAAAAAAYSRLRVAFTFSAGRCRACVNGTLLTLTPSATMFTPTQLAIGANSAGDSTLGGGMFRAGAYTAVLTDAELQALTAA